MDILFSLSEYMRPFLIPSGTRVSLFPPSVKAKATMVWSSKFRSSFCPHFHSLCPAGLQFCCGIWEKFPFVHKWHQASGCDIHENQTLDDHEGLQPAYIIRNLCGEYSEVNPVRSTTGIIAWTNTCCCVSFPNKLLGHAAGGQCQMC